MPFFPILLLLLLFANQRNILLNLQSMANKNMRFFPQNVSVFLEVCLKSVTSYSLCDNTVNLADIVKPFLNSSSLRLDWRRRFVVAGRSCQSGINTHTDQLLDSRWPERSGHGTLIAADKLPLVASDDFFGRGRGGCVSAHAAMSRQQTWKSGGREREEGGAKWGGANLSEVNKKIYENAKKWETAFTVTCCHTNPIGKFTAVPNKNSHCVNSMGNTKHLPSSQSSASLCLWRRARRSFIPQMPVSLLLSCRSQDTFRAVT